MAKKKAQHSEETNGINPVAKTARTVLLAAIGAVSLGKEEIEAIVNRLVEKGEIAEKDGRELISDLMERRRQEVDKAENKAEGALDQRIESILHRMNVPSKGDVEDLSRKIGNLSQMVDDLNKKMAE